MLRNKTRICLMILLCSESSTEACKLWSPLEVSNKSALVVIQLDEQYGADQAWEVWPLFWQLCSHWSALARHCLHIPLASHEGHYSKEHIDVQAEHQRSCETKALKAPITWLCVTVSAGGHCTCVLWISVRCISCGQASDKAQWHWYTGSRP